MAAKKNVMKNGVIRRGDGAYSYVIQVPDPATGKKKPIWFSGFTSWDEAKVARELAVGALRAGTYVVDDRQSLGAFLQTWIDTKQASPKTLSGYRYNIEKYVIPRIGGTRLQQVTPHGLTQFYADIRANGGKNGGELGWRSVESVASTLSSALGTAERRLLIPRNPAQLADLPPKPVSTARADHELAEFQVFDPSELSAFCAYAIDAHRLGAFFYLAASTGARRGELCHLRWKDVDLDRRQLHLRGSRGPVDNPGDGPKQIAVDGPTKTKKPRTVSINDATVSVLRQHRQRQVADRLKAGPHWVDDDDFVFRTERGEPIWPETPTRMMKDLCAGSGVKRLSLHELRHSHATILLNHGVPIHEVSQRLGHANTNETLRVYARVIRARQDSLGDVFADALRTSS